MQRYEKYKDSGIEWIGEIPEHWEIKRVKFIISNELGLQIGPFGSSLRSEYIRNVGYKIFGQENVIKDDFTLGYKYLDEDKFNELIKYELFPGDIVITMMGTTGKCKIVPENIEKGIMDSHLIRIRVNNDKVLEKFFAVLINDSYSILNNIKYESKGSIMEGLNSSIIKSLYIPLPNINEQTSIINFINRKTAEIDQIIANKQKLIALYEEEKQAIINQAVTKGLDPNVKMKDLGVEWLGKIPEHWEVKKLRYLCKITTGEKDTENREDEGEYPFYVRSQTIEKISTYSYDCEGILTAGDGVGVCKVWHYVNDKFDFHQRVYLMYDFVEVCGKFLFYYMKENFIHDVLRQSAKSTVDSLRRPMFLDFIVVFPKNEIEQQSIVTHIEKECARLDTIISKFNKQIDLLQEYRTTLISEVVTGKIKVCE